MAKNNHKGGESLPLARTSLLATPSSGGHPRNAPVDLTIEAPYELPEGWKWCRLGDVCKFENGYAFKSDKFTTSGIPVIRITNIKDNEIDLENCVYTSETDIEERFIVKTGDLLIAMSGATTGKNGVYLYDKTVYLNQRVGNIKVINSNILNDKYRNFYIQSKEQEILKNAYGGAQPNISSNKICEMLFPLPLTLAEQQRIVNRIETMFAKLDQAQEKAQSVLDSFETRKAAILHKAFTGELTANWRKENGVPDDSWEEKKLGEIASKITDGEHSTPKRVNEFCGYYLLSARNIHNGEILLDDVDYVEKDEYERIRKRCNPDKGDILISCSGSVGRVCVIQDDNKYVMVRSAAMVKLEQDNPFYVAYMLQSFNVQQQIERTKKQSCQANLFLGAIKELSIPLPTYTEQIEIVKIIDRIIKNEEKAKQAAVIVLQQIDILKKSILVRAFRGEL